MTDTEQPCIMSAPKPAKNQPWKQYLSTQRLQRIEDTCKTGFEGTGNVRTRFEVTAKK
jgi:hypothetical protein